MIRPPRGIIFDLDGTLITPTLDLHAIRRALDLPPEADILEAVSALPDDEATRALSLIADIEAQAASHIELMPGFDTLMRALHTRSVPSAIVTRNNAHTLHTFLASVPYTFSPALHRDSLNLPPKPQPHALLHIAHAWSLPPQQLLMVGDGTHDLDAAHAADIPFALLSQHDNHDLASRAHLVLRSLDQLLDHL